MPNLTRTARVFVVDTLGLAQFVEPDARTLELDEAMYADALADVIEQALAEEPALTREAIAEAQVAIALERHAAATQRARWVEAPQGLLD